MRSILKRLRESRLGPGELLLADALGGVLGAVGAGAILLCALAFCPELLDEIAH
jgi:hypothetical protein